MADVDLEQQVLRRVVRQFSAPTGIGGALAGWVMGCRSSNVSRNRWAVNLLAVEPTDRVIEFGCGPGVAIEAFAERVPGGLVVGIDRSPVMIRQARRRNRRAVAAGRVRLVVASVEDVDEPLGSFDAALAVNTVGFWPEPDVRLAEIRELLRPGGRIAVVSQPRCPGATSATSMAAGVDLTRLLEFAGFTISRVDTLPLDPPAVCVIASDTPVAHGCGVETA